MFKIGFLERYRARKEWDTIQKSRPVKYIRRYPKASGKGWNYVYKDSWKHPFKALLECFGIKQKRIDDDYTGNNIKKDYGVDKKTFAAHVLEYFTNKIKWDNLFSKKEVREKYRNPVKQEDVQGRTKAFSEKKEAQNPTEDKMVINRSLMRKVWSIYSVEGQRAELLESEAEKYANRSNAMKGNKNAEGTFKFSSLGDKEKSELGNKIKNNVVSSVESGIIKKTDEKTAAKAAQEWVEENYKTPADTVIGEVEIKKGNIKDSLSHGFGQDKLDAIPAVKDVLEKGTYLGYENDFKGATLRNHYFAGKVKFPGGDKIVFCRVRESAGDTSKRFYVHEVFTEDEIKKGATTRSSNDSLQRLTGKPQKDLTNAPTDGSLPHFTGKPQEETSLQTSTAEKGWQSGRRLYSFILQDVLDVKENQEKPQTDAQTKAEKKSTEKAREKAGLPPVDEAYGERVSAIDDLSWDPNNENYRYKDTGYIAGARKELALSQIRVAGRNKTRLREEDIDWRGVEENKRAAKEVIVKSNVFGSVDWETLRKDGMTGGAAFLIDRVYSMIGKEPVDDNAEARRQYVIALNGLRDRLETAKSVQDVEDTLEDIGEELNGRFRSVRDTDEYKEKAAKVDGLAKKAVELRKKDNELFKAYYREERAAENRMNDRLTQWLKENKIIKGTQKYNKWNEDYYKFSAAQKSEFESLKEQVKKEEFSKYKELFDARKKFQEDNGFLKNEKYVYPDGSYTYIDYSVEKEWHNAEQELTLWEREQGTRAILENPLYKAWFQLGDKFRVITCAAWKNKTFYRHKSDARSGKYDDWEWLENDVVEASGKGRERKARFEFLVAKEYNRKGGRNVTAKSTQELKELFNLRDVQSGNWVLKDPESAKFHVDRMAESFADLCDITGIPDNLVSLNGRLAIAIGARGKGGENPAKAHYEPVERVINITKMKGGGSLGHEWFHAFDNMIMEAMGGEEGTSGVFMTNKYARLTKTQKDLLQTYFEAENSVKNGSGNLALAYRLQQAKAACEKKGVKIPENPKEQFQLKVAGAFDNLVKAMTEGSVPVLEKLTYSVSDWDLAKWNVKSDSKGLGKQIYEAGSLDGAMKVINERFRDKYPKNRTEWARIAAAYYNGNPDTKVGFNSVMVDLGRKGTDFLQKAKQMDFDGGKEYWASSHEMAARAFSAYLDDKLRAQGRFNDYLANYTKNEYYKSALGDVFPYPEGEERKNINKAFDELFKTVAETNAIRKSLYAISHRENGIFQKKRDKAENDVRFGRTVQKAWCWFDRHGNFYIRKKALKAMGKIR